jgi:hypothetical protein
LGAVGALAHRLPKGGPAADRTCGAQPPCGQRGVDGRNAAQSISSHPRVPSKPPQAYGGGEGGRLQAQPAASGRNPIAPRTFQKCDGGADATAPQRRHPPHRRDIKTTCKRHAGSSLYNKQIEGIEFRADLTPCGRSDTRSPECPISLSQTCPCSPRPHPWPLV